MNRFVMFGGVAFLALVIFGMSNGQQKAMGGHGCCGCYGYSACSCYGGCYCSCSCYGSHHVGLHGWWRSHHACYGGSYCSCSCYGGVRYHGYHGCYSSCACSCSSSCYSSCSCSCYSSCACGGTIVSPQVEVQVEAKTSMRSNKADARIAVKVPADAKIFVNDKPTTSTGVDRVFVSRNLAKGKQYRYTLRIEAVRDGEPVVETREVKLTANDDVNLVFDLDTAAAASLASTK